MNAVETPFKCNGCSSVVRQAKQPKRCECGGFFIRCEQKTKRAEPRAGRPGSESAKRSAPFESPRSSGAVPEGHEGARARAPKESPWIGVLPDAVKAGDEVIDPPTGCALRVAFVDREMRSLAKPQALLFIGYERKGGAPLGYFAAPAEVLRVKGTK